MPTPRSPRRPPAHRPPTRRRLLTALGALSTAGLTTLAGCTDDANDATGDGADGGADDEAAGPTTTPTSTRTDEAATGSTDSGTGSTDDTADTDVTPSDDRTTTGAGSGTPAGDLDLREANVTAVAVERSGDGYRFDVTLYHDDDGEDGYANWWQVESLAGERLGRRELLHAHGTREFTRSATVEVPEGAACVVVRGHDRTHGYGGQAMLVALDDGATVARRQGPETQSFDESDCP